jgi:hypothetical protein
MNTLLHNTAAHEEYYLDETPVLLTEKVILLHNYAHINTASACTLHMTSYIHVLPSICICHETTVKTIWWPVSNNINFHPTYSTLPPPLSTTQKQIILKI